MEYTGRKFKCVGLKEKDVELWSSGFNINEIYKEVKTELDCPEDLFLETELEGLVLYVDKCQFKEIK